MPSNWFERVHLTLNADYPHTTPKGGTGYGIVKTVTVE